MVKIIFATLTGNTERVATYVKEQLDTKGSSAELHRAEDTQMSIFNKEDHFIIAASTWNLGEMNQFIQHLYDKLPDTDMSGVKMAFIGLGDKIYGEDHFCKAVIDFREVAIKQGVNEIVDMLYVDGEPEMVMDTEVKAWVDELIEKLKKS